MKNVECGTNLCQKLKKGAKKLYFCPYFLIVLGNYRQVDYYFTVYTWNKPALETCCFGSLATTDGPFAALKLHELILQNQAASWGPIETFQSPICPMGHTLWITILELDDVIVSLRVPIHIYGRKNFSRKSGNTNVWPLFPKDLQMCHYFLSWL